MKELFEKEIKEAENKLYEKGLYVNKMMEPYNDQFEIWNGFNVVIDHLSVAQLVQLADLLTNI